MKVSTGDTDAAENGTAEEELTPADYRKRLIKIILRYFVTIAGTVLIFILLLVLLLVFCFSCDLSEHYTRFGKRRTAEVESDFSITVTDDVRLVQFDIEPAYWLDDDSETITLMTPDYNSFIENNIRAEVHDLEIACPPDEEKEKLAGLNKTDRLSIASFGYDIYGSEYHGRVYKYPDDEEYTVSIWVAEIK